MCRKYGHYDNLARIKEFRRPDWDRGMVKAPRRPDPSPPPSARLRSVVFAFVSQCRRQDHVLVQR